MTALPQQHKTWRGYLLGLGLWLVGALAFVGACNLMMDPLGVLGSPKVQGINALKPYLDHHRELTRWKAAERACAPTGIFGNSRAEIGLDPENPHFVPKAFNHAIPGSSLHQTWRQLNWLEEAGCLPKTWIIGVDFFDFLGGTRPQPLASLASHPAPHADARFLAEVVFSLSGLRDSVRTLAIQHTRNPAILTERGFNPLLNYADEVSQNGHESLFRQRAQENINQWRRRPALLRQAGDAASDDEIVLQAILARATRSGATVQLLIYPYHAQMRVILARLGFSTAWDDWKRQLVRMAEQVPPADAAVQVWDFSGLSTLTLEAIPARGDRTTQLTYYWEGGHFKSSAGDLMAARLHGHRSEWGHRLESTTLEAWLSTDAEALRRLLAENGQLVRDTDRLLDGAGAQAH